MNIVYFLKLGLEKIDIFAMPITLYFNEKDKYRTVIGGTFSFLIFIFIIVTL